MTFMGGEEEGETLSIFCGVASVCNDESTNVLLNVSVNRVDLVTLPFLLK